MQLGEFFSKFVHTEPRWLRVRLLFVCVQAMCVFHLGELRALPGNRWLTQFEVELCHEHYRFHSCALMCFICCWCSGSVYPQDWKDKALAITPQSTTCSDKGQARGKMGGTIFPWCCSFSHRDVHKHAHIPAPNPHPPSGLPKARISLEYGERWGGLCLCMHYMNCVCFCVGETQKRSMIIQSKRGYEMHCNMWKTIL